MNAVEPKDVCPDCGAVVARIDGPTHAYFGSNAGCWQVYCEILEKEYSDPRYMKVHRLTVDAYAAQHPGKQDEPRAIQSVNVHLVSLYLVLERHMPVEVATRALAILIKKRKHGFGRLAPPSSLGALNVLDVAIAENPEQHAQRVHDWATSVWKAWHPHRKEIEELAREIDRG